MTVPGGEPLESALGRDLLRAVDVARDPLAPSLRGAAKKSDARDVEPGSHRNPSRASRVYLPEGNGNRRRVEP